MNWTQHLEILLVAFGTLTWSQTQPDSAQAVSSLCGAATCGQNSTCHVVQACVGSVCPPKFACLQCVPRDADVPCHLNGYSAAVLIGPVTQPSSLMGRGCDPNQPGGEPNCPLNSVCVLDDQSGRGTCCYGKELPGERKMSHSNSSTYCPSLCGECRPEHVCRKVAVVCKKLPCPPRYECVERDKKGYCPVYTSLASSWCSRHRRIRCSTDFECYRNQKCCGDLCGGLRCKRPRPPR